MIYDYQCNSCQHEVLDVVQKLSDEPLKVCPSCGCESLERIMLSAPHVSCPGEPQTVGQLAERNTKKMGRYELDSKHEKDKEYHQKRKEHQEINKIANLSDSDKKKYIRGELNV